MAEGETGTEAPVVELKEPVSPGEEAPKWASKRIDKLTGDLYKERAQIAELQKKLADLQGQIGAAGGDPGSKPAPMDEQAIQERIKAEAEKLADTVAFNRECNKSYEVGASKYPDFKDKMAALQKDIGIPMDFVRIVMDFDGPHDIFYLLANDKDRAEEIMGMSPHRAAVALSKLQDEQKKKPGPKARSNAPDPIGEGAVRGNAGGDDMDLDDDKLTMAQFAKKREAQIAERRKAGGRR
jgi:hypothetical protein